MVIAVVDIQFDEKLLKILNTLEIEVPEGYRYLVLEVAQYLGENSTNDLVIS